jgi:hypothetical protein
LVNVVGHIHLSPDTNDVRGETTRRTVVRA